MTTNDRSVAERVKLLRNYGQSRKYHHDLVGINSRLDELQAAVLRVKLSRLDKWNEKRRRLAGVYKKIAAKYKFCYIAEPLAQYRIHASNTWGLGRFQGEAKRVAAQESIMLLEYALSQWHDQMSAQVKATAFMKLGAYYYNLGQRRKTLMYFCRAFAYDPFRRSNLQYPRRCFQFTRDVLGREIVERT